MPTYTREQLHKDIDQLLDEHHFGQELKIPFGKLTFEVSFEYEEVVTRIRERITEKRRKTL